ncbi:MAG: hypothetical protein PVG65_00390 [Candidatus Thorarchaeota archaeon]|jgi:hypothetical protein
MTINSVLFLLAARETLCLIAESSILEKNQKDILRDFIINEATDYQIMSLLLDGELPDSEIDAAEEQGLFNRFKGIIEFNKELVCEMFGFDTYNDVVEKINPLYPKLSTTKPVLAFQSTNGLNSLLEAPFSEISGAAKLALQRSKERLKKKAIAKAKTTVKKGAEKAAKKDPLAALPKAYKGTGKKLVKTVSPEKTHRAAPMKALGKGKVSTASTKTQATTSTKTQAGTIQAVKAKAQNALSAVTDFLKKPAGQAIGGAALAALALYASYKVYKRFLSKAARACRGLSGAEKTSCMKKYKVGAYNAQVKDLQAASKACAKSKNPAKCKASIAKKIYKIKKKVAKVT